MAGLSVELRLVLNLHIVLLLRHWQHLLGLGNQIVRVLLQLVGRLGFVHSLLNDLLGLDLLRLRQHLALSGGTGSCLVE